MTDTMRDQDRVAGGPDSIARIEQAARNATYTVSLEGAHDCLRKIATRLAALQSQQDGAQGGEAVAEVSISEASIDLHRLRGQDDAALLTRLGVGVHSLYTRPAIAPQGEADVWAVYHDKEGQRSWDYIGDETAARVKADRCNMQIGKFGAPPRYVAVALYATPQATPAARDAARWRHVREVFAEEMLDNLFGIDSCPDADPTHQLDAACDADIESDAALAAPPAEVRS